MQEPEHQVNKLSSHSARKPKGDDWVLWEERPHTDPHDWVQDQFNVFDALVWSYRLWVSNIDASHTSARWSRVFQRPNILLIVIASVPAALTPWKQIAVLIGWAPFR
ncbi:hypothetical protein RRG08_027764 [Elysia crispata]|uniref:Uncharacterized protein n=1 Tax=Elysia crispata TaxID=231223 RepID=A0AAE0Z974_9GAST|nr:hypothetical protein RRG08_027764 [Elysia crispata]